MPETSYQQWLRERGLGRVGTGVGTGQPREHPLLPQKRTTWSTLLDVVNTPANLVASGVHAAQQGEDLPQHLWDALRWKEKHNFGEILGDAGVEPGAYRTALGLGLDIGTDPLTYVPGAAMVKGWKALGSGAAKVTKSTRSALPLLDEALTVAGASKPAQYVDTALNAITPGRELRHVGALTGGRYSTNAAVREMELAAARGQSSLDAEKRFKPALQALRDEIAQKLKMPGQVPAGTRVGTKLLGERMDVELNTIADAIEAGHLGGLSPAGQQIGKRWQEFAEQRFKRTEAGGVIRSTWKRPNYLTHAFPDRASLRSSSQARILGDPAFVQRRSFDTLVQARLEGLVPDVNIMRLASSHQMEGDRAIIFKRFFDDLFREGADNPLKTLYMKIGEGGTIDPALKLVATQKKWQTVRLPWQEVPLAGDVPEANKLVDYAFHPDVARDLEAMFTITPEPGVIGRIVDKLHNIWKPLATVVRPSFMIRNMISNMYMSIPAGLKTRDIPKYYTQAFKLLQPRLAQTFGKKSQVALEIAEADPRVILGKATGITGVVFGAVGEISTETGAAMKTLMSRKREVIQALSPVKVGRAINSFSEDVGRMGLFLNELDRRGLDTPLLQKIVRWSQPENLNKLTSAEATLYHDTMVQIREASLHVNKWLINYAIKTPFERKYAQRWIPFYSWSRRIVPLLLETAATQPRILAFQAKLKGELEQNVPPGERMAEGRRPEWMQETGYAQIPSLVRGERTFAGTGLPGPDLNILPFPGGSSLDQAAQELAGRITPLKSFPEAFLANRNISMGPDASIWQNRPGELKRASGILTLFAEALPDLAIQAGMVKQGEAWLAPARVNYLSANLAPIAESIGKAARASVPGKEPDPEVMARQAWNIMFGLPNVQRDTPAAEARRVQGAKRIKTSAAKDLAKWLAQQRAKERK